MTLRSQIGQAVESYGLLANIENRANTEEEMSPHTDAHKAVDIVRCADRERTIADNIIQSRWRRSTAYRKQPCCMNLEGSVFEVIDDILEKVGKNRVCRDYLLQHRDPMFADSSCDPAYDIECDRKLVDNHYAEIFASFAIFDDVLKWQEQQQLFQRTASLYFPARPSAMGIQRFGSLENKLEELKVSFSAVHRSPERGVHSLTNISPSKYHDHEVGEEDESVTVSFKERHIKLESMISAKEAGPGEKPVHYGIHASSTMVPSDDQCIRAVTSVVGRTGGYQFVAHLENVQTRQAFNVVVDGTDKHFPAGRNSRYLFDFVQWIPELRLMVGFSPSGVHAKPSRDCM